MLYFSIIINSVHHSSTTKKMIRFSIKPIQVQLELYLKMKPKMQIKIKLRMHKMPQMINTTPNVK